jgi:predicted KAP-like P-loop ATPase
MASGTMLNDRSIQTPDEDYYGLDPFARALAISISNMAAPEGVVLAVNGPWGSGKSGVINLIEHHLRAEVESSRLRIVRFSPWWFAGAEALTRAFFEAFNAALDGALQGKVRKRAKEALGAVYQRLKPLKQIGAVGTNVAAQAPIGSAAVAVMDYGMELLGVTRAIEKEFELLAKVLRSQNKRFLVVVDDIDRLDPEDAILVFRLVKSIGRLPNVIYLLAFHREVADRHLRRRFESSASEYLEKIVQVSYELPIPTPEALLRTLLGEIGGTLPGAETPRDITRFGNLLHDCVAPWLRTPRDVVRLANAMRVGWPVVSGEVDAADFMALEALKLAHPGTYRSVQLNPQILCDAQSTLGSRGREKVAGHYDVMLLSDVPEAERAVLRTALRRLFPRLDNVWGNVLYDEHSAREWHRNRLVCSRAHFDTYFRLAPGERAVPAAEVNALLSKLDDIQYVRTVFRRALALHRQLDGRTRASLLLDELTIQALEIPAKVVPNLLRALFEIADDLDVIEDQDRSFMGIADNQLRLHWLLNPLVLDRLDLGQRSALLTSVAESAQIGWLVDLARRCVNANRPKEGQEDLIHRGPITDDAATENLRNAALEAMRTAARVGTLLRHRRVVTLLHAWANFADDDGAQVRRWTNAALESDAAVVRLAEAFTSVNQSISLGDSTSFLGDRVATSSINVDRAGVARVCDLDRLVARVEELRAQDIPTQSKHMLDQFVEGLRSAAHREMRVDSPSA